MNTTYFVERSAHGTNQITLKSKLLEKRIIFLDKKIDSESMNEIIQQISLLSIESPDEPITMLINSTGGSILNGMVIIDAMNSCPCEIRTVSLGIAASMAAVILAAGSKRFASVNSQVMLHQPLVQGLPGGSCSEIEDVANSLMKTKAELDRLLTRLTGKSIKTIRKLTSKDTYMTAEEALEYGLIDAIAEGNLLNNLLTGGMIE